MRSRTRVAVAFAALLAIAAPALAPWIVRHAPRADEELWRMLTLQICFAGLALAVALRLGGSLRERLGLVPSRLGSVPLALGLIGTLALSGALQFGVEALALTPGTALERLSDLAAEAGSSSPWLMGITFTLAPALSEELLCRGLLQRSLARGVGGWSIPIAAAVFAALHADRVQSPAAFLLGGYLGAVAWFAGSTLPAIGCHLFNNGAAAFQSLAPAAGAALPRPTDWGEAAIWLAASGACLALVARAPGARTARGDPSA